MKNKMKLLAIFVFVASTLFSCKDNIVIELPSLDHISNSVSSKPSTWISPCSSTHKYEDKVTPPTINETSYYVTKDDVALYINTFHKLPQNFITKNEFAEKGNNEYGSNTRIGGDYFSNKYGNNQYSIYRFSYLIECDILNHSITSTNNRGEKRILFTDSTYQIFYTDDHYDSFQEYLGYKSWGPKFNKGQFIAICK